MDRRAAHRPTADAERLSAALAAAFQRTPSGPGCFRTPGGARRACAGSSTSSCAGWRSSTQRLGPSDLAGASSRCRSGHWRMPVGVTVARGPAFFACSAPARSRSPASRMEWRHLREPHYYFPYIGVTPAAQAGLGSRLMRPTLERCDAESLPAYLEATNARNVHAVRAPRLRGDRRSDLRGSPPLRLMVRRPR